MVTPNSMPTQWARTRDHGFAVLDVSDIRNVELLAFAGTDSFGLMEKAGVRSAQKILDHMRHSAQPSTHFIVFAGPGNNGGDACVVAAELQRLGASVELVQCRLDKPGSRNRQRADALCKTQGVRETDLENFEFKGPCVVVDGLLGIGCQTKPVGELAKLIRQINTHAQLEHVFALDIPSGLNADTGMSLGCTVQADTTLTFIACKPGLLSSQGKDFAGEVLINTLDCESWIQTQQLEKAFAVRAESDHTQLLRLPKRGHGDHKGSFGAVGVIGGAPGMAGAVLLAGRSAIQMGAGRVAFSLMGELDKFQSQSRSRHYMPFLDGQYPELMNKPLQANLEFANVLALGTGMGETDLAKNTLESIFQEIEKPMVLDADALNLLAKNPDLQKTLLNARVLHASALVMTPHPLEAGRLLNCPVDQVQANRLACARKLAMRYQCVVVLKGSGTLIVDPYHSEINASGGPLLATAGSGDVLTGCVAALLAQGLAAFDAASLAVWLHGLACDPLACETHAPTVGHASTLIDRMNMHLNQLRQKRTRFNRELPVAP